MGKMIAARQQQFNDILSMKDYANGTIKFQI